jgi:hypothetical protein
MAHEYESGDLDFISMASSSRIAEAIAPLGFERKRADVRPLADSALRRVPGRAARYRQRADWRDEVGEKQTAAGTIRLLTPTQCVMDRLAAYFHWNDLQSLDQAVMVASSQEVSIARLDAWAKREGESEKLRKFKQELATRKHPR